MNTSVFPIDVWADSVTGYSPSHFQKAFIRTRPSKLSWYCFDVCIHTPDTIEFIAYGMADPVYGGKGKVLAQWQCQVNPSLTLPHIEHKCFELAREQRRIELQASEEQIVGKLAKAYLDKVYKS